MVTPKVLILMACYNGGAYIPAAVESLLTQDYDNLQIILSDDHSTDETPEILAKIAAENPGILRCYRPAERCGSAQKHFMHLIMAFHDAPYIMFCDQDDIWHPDKVRKTLHRMQQIEEKNVPAMVHTDLRVVDRELKEISPSFCAHSRLDGNRLAFRHLLVQNVVTGCTMMINGTLADLACRDVDMDAMLMHDWWIALLASSCGKAAFLPEATIDYRQHGANAVGAKDVHSASFLWKRLTSQSMRQSLKAAACQGKAFQKAYSDILTQEQTEILDAFASAVDASFFRRNKIYFQYGLIKKGLIRSVAQILGL